MVMALQIANQLVDDLAEELEVSDSRYEAAIRSYNSIGEWLRRPASAFADTHVEVYPQGSFRLGTAIRPVTDEEDYDLDIVCEIFYGKESVTQEWLHRQLGEEMKAYASAHTMTVPERSNRVWTLHYADGAQFHMDVLPSVPDGRRMQAIMRMSGYQTSDDTSVAITDYTHPNFRVRSPDWPVSNPKGYADWFVSRMRVALQKRLASLRERASVNVAQIPDYKVKTPLQSAVQILKRHRDMRFKDSPDLRPRSIIITTLAAHAYQQEPTLSEALVSILGRMDQYIETNGDESRISNPTNDRENFADAWSTNKALKDAFYDWLDTARLDFNAAAQELDPARFTDILAPRMGRRLVEASMARSRRLLGSQRSSLVARATAPLVLVDAPHRKPVPWQQPPPGSSTGSVKIVSARCDRNGFRPFHFRSNGDPLPKRASLIFEADTDVAPPYRVYWQIVNTGQQARDARGLRGGFEEVSVVRGYLKREESTRYMGSHSVECFIVKNNYCVARSGQFVVNIE
ncbi:nucleotidyltransferase [Polyangium jinanense]|uniref:Nucleotidyltransferase n=1 Tax=Polyangium jinanense TaxID=2829994 RepID=A0A9X4AX44_9BACT|nr:nucleotidyltransferase [Polyangium jinanense]MDC3985955.1 nucleotidyltransferase [Polyangium jinanense]